MPSFKNSAPNAKFLQFSLQFSIFPNSFRTHQKLTSHNPMSSSSTLFIALQCCQCSTMQVKQKKKSSNKWSCAICNQKQSIRKVFAQGFMAKDIRKFVQTFNMSRKSLDDGQFPLAESLDPSPEHCDGEPEFPVERNKKRNDWSEYLDQEDHRTIKEQEQEHYGDDFEPLVVTELPKGVFKKRRLEENSTRRSDKFYKKSLYNNTQEKSMIDQGRIASLNDSTSERKYYLTPNNPRNKNCKPAINKIASKWNDYLTEDNENLELGWNRAFNLKDNLNPGNSSILEAITSEQRVEDDIHSDFL